MATIQWTCPFCSTRQIVSDKNHSRGFAHLSVGETVHGTVALWYDAIRCVNDDCNHVTVNVSVDQGDWLSLNTFHSEREIVRASLLPRSFAKLQPEYIPQALRNDYEEACLIRDDSPKASATLARRALQGMLHDFCEIRERTLFDEIAKLEAMLKEGSAPRGVEEETIAAIHAVRKIGNIGAHMESDINVIVDVDPGEAQALIDLIELLFEEWYVARHVRQARLARILEIDGVKQEARKPKVAQDEVPAALPAPEK